MKIGIMTFHASHNCGSMLQAFALQYVLSEKYGAEVEIIDYSNWHQRNLYNVFDMRPNKKAILYDIAILPHVKIMRKQRKDYVDFSNKYLSLSKDKYTCWSQLKNSYQKYDLLIAGGDQVWNIRCRDHDDAYYLNFAHGIRKVAYSPSLGAQNVNVYAKDPNVYRKYLEDFEMLSVREVNGQKWLRELTGKDIPIIADPTLLLSKEEWDEILGLEKIDEPYIFNYAYYHDKEETNEAIHKVSQITNLPVYTIDYKSCCLYKLDRYGIKMYEMSGPWAMLNLMKNATLVLTQSLHGTIFSALFNKTFWAYHNSVIRNKDDDRARSLLNQLGLRDRLIPINTLPERADLTSELDYNSVNSKIQNLRREAYLYIDKFMNK